MLYQVWITCNAFGQRVLVKTFRSRKTAERYIASQPTINSNPTEIIEIKIK